MTSQPFFLKLCDIITTLTFKCDTIGHFYLHIWEHYEAGIDTKGEMSPHTILG
jgi:hypothetical protein